ncbi:peptidyl-tRNA hydrolase, PTH1 family [Monoraphidium neglectum]|uniref:peptidyl-tRNA hydrolase n=1 Tax=Monoraphidium neglectum TaxID=145388 RepID=A0A0D2M881_9CHLO|nr:peptidyl-tRNA hydrolase, PTH1 family [Monoraphidium neglectum]KIY97326.1 peptidyl-tRNA hydrolase, PTH1 family [Monoraphidium neglectum]|eukprot:XP_013896346.1 peptidyl-tRNA hydrolase, PTH1 family [Monoraphidium neglectum]
MLIDALARSEGIDVRKLEKSAAVGRGEVAGRKVLLAKPVTFMVGGARAAARDGRRRCRPRDGSWGARGTGSAARPPPAAGPSLGAGGLPYLNNSGDSVVALAKYYKVPLSRCLVVSDDLDSPTATVRLKQRGGHGGHNGLRSIIERFGGKSDFPRLKIGIGRPTGNLDVASYVLQDFRQSEMAEVDDAIRESIAIIHSILTLGLEKALSGSRV